MGLNDGLYDSLKAHLDWGKPRLECFVGMLLGLLWLKQINLTQLAVGFSSDTDIKSRYRRLQRFFAGCILITMPSPAYRCSCLIFLDKKTT